MPAAFSRPGRTAPRRADRQRTARPAGRPSGTASSDEQTVPKPPRASTLSCSPGSPERSARTARQLCQSSGSGGAAARNRGRCRATRGLSGSSGSWAVTMCRPGDNRSACGRPWPRPRTKIAPPRSASTRLKLRHSPASSAPIADAAASASACASARSGSSPRLRLPAAGPRLPGRFSTAATTPARLIPIQVPPPERSRPATTSGRSGQCAAGGSQARSSISSRLAASTSGQAWPGRIRTTTVHMRRRLSPIRRLGHNGRPRGARQRLRSLARRRPAVPRMTTPSGQATHPVAAERVLFDAEASWCRIVATLRPRLPAEPSQTQSGAGPVGGRTVRTRQFRRPRLPLDLRHEAIRVARARRAPAGTHDPRSGQGQAAIAKISRVASRRRLMAPASACSIRLPALATASTGFCATTRPRPRAASSWTPRSSR